MEGSKSSRFSCFYVADMLVSSTEEWHSADARLRDIKASQLGGIAARAALAELPPSVEVDQVFFG